MSLTPGQCGIYGMREIIFRRPGMTETLADLMLAELERHKFVAKPGRGGEIAYQEAEFIWQWHE